MILNYHLIKAITILISVISYIHYYNNNIFIPKKESNNFVISYDIGATTFFSLKLSPAKSEISEVYRM